MVWYKIIWYGTKFGIEPPSLNKQKKSLSNPSPSRKKKWIRAQIAYRISSSLSSMDRDTGNRSKTLRSSDMFS